MNGCSLGPVSLEIGQGSVIGLGDSSGTKKSAYISEPELTFLPWYDYDISLPTKLIWQLHSQSLMLRH